MADTTLRILHISDLHMRSAEGPQRERAVIEAAVRWRVIGEAWKRNLEELATTGRFDIVAFTGDLADWGHPTDYPDALVFLRSVCSTLAVPLSRLFVIPGNHDIARKTNEDVWAKLREEIPQVDAGAVSQWMANGGSAPRGFEIGWRDQILHRESTFWSAISNDLQRPELLPSRSPHGRLGYRSTVDGFPFPVHLVGLDTAWLAGDLHDSGKLLLTDHQVERLATDDKGKSLAGLRIALMHHRFADLADGARMRKILADRVDLLLHGHQHDPTADLSADPDRALLVLAAGCLYEGDVGHRYLNAFQVIDVTADAQGRPHGVSVRFRGWSDRNLFWGDDALLYQRAANGRLVLQRNGERWEPTGARGGPTPLPVTLDGLKIQVPVSVGVEGATQGIAIQSGAAVQVQNSMLERTAVNVDASRPGTGVNIVGSVMREGELNVGKSTIRRDQRSYRLWVLAGFLVALAALGWVVTRQSSTDTPSEAEKLRRLGLTAPICQFVAVGLTAPAQDRSLAVEPSERLVQDCQAAGLRACTEYYALSVGLNEADRDRLLPLHCSVSVGTTPRVIFTIPFEAPLPLPAKEDSRPATSLDGVDSTTPWFSELQASRGTICHSSLPAGQLLECSFRSQEACAKHIQNRFGHGGHPELHRCGARPGTIYCFQFDRTNVNRNNCYLSAEGCDGEVKAFRPPGLRAISRCLPVSLPSP